MKFDDPINHNFFKGKIKELLITNSQINSKINTKKKNIEMTGEYSVNNEKYLKFKLANNINKSLLNFQINLEYDKSIELDLINYKKSKDKLAKISINLDKYQDFYNIKQISYNEGKNSMSLEGIKFKNNKILSLKEILVKTFSDNLINNDFKIFFDKKKIVVRGKKFDATNISKILNKKNKNNMFSNINKDIEIDFLQIAVPLSEKIRNFTLIGNIKNGEFTKINSKVISEIIILDINMRSDKDSNKKYLEVYSDLTKPLLSEFSFFKGLTGGKLLYSSVFDDASSSAKLKIENFKVINAPGMVKLLSLADLGGLADLAEGEGISFKTLEIKMDKDKETLKLNEILALGPSISVLMEGYQDANVTSLKGTLVPAKTLNKMISKIPVLGDIIIPKEVGEGLFGISFKMKGPPGNIKTTINPIRTITPRFLQKIIDKDKIAK